MSKNVRKDKRAPVALKVRFKSATVDEFIEQYSTDISKGGIFIRSNEPMAVGTLLKFEFKLRDNSPLIQGVGRVVWKRDQEEASEEMPPGMGIKFIKMDERSKAIVERIVAGKEDLPDSKKDENKWGGEEKFDEDIEDLEDLKEAKKEEPEPIKKEEEEKEEEEKKAEEKVEEKKPEEKKTEAKAEEKKPEEKKIEAKVEEKKPEEKKTEAKAEAKAEEKKPEEKKTEAKAEEKKPEKKAEEKKPTKTESKSSSWIIWLAIVIILGVGIYVYFSRQQTTQSDQIDSGENVVDLTKVDAEQKNIQEQNQIDAGIKAEEKITYKINSIPPGALVKIDGQEKGATPVTIQDLDKGAQLQVELKLPGYKTYSSSITLDEQTLSTPLEVQMESLPIEFVINSNPEKAGVYLGNKILGLTPLRYSDKKLSLPVELTIKKAGFDPVIQNIDLSNSDWREVDNKFVLNIEIILNKTAQVVPPQQQKIVKQQPQQQQPEQQQAQPEKQAPQPEKQAPQQPEKQAPQQPEKQAPQQPEKQAPQPEKQGIVPENPF